MFHPIGIVFSCLLLVLNITGSLDALQTPITQFTLDARHVVTEIEPGSPESIAGMSKGDEILEVNGSPLASFSPFDGSKMRIGSSTHYRIRRADGAVTDIHVTWNDLTKARKIRIVINAIFTFVVLGIGLSVMLMTPPTTNALLFFFLSMFYVFFKMNHPHFDNEILARLYQAIYLFAFFLIPSFFIHFCSRFPKLSRLIHGKESRTRWIYVPPVILAIPAAISNWIHASDIDAQSVVTQIIVLQGFLIWLVYLVLGSMMLIHGFFRIRSRQLSRRCVLVFYTLILAVSPYLFTGVLDVLFHKTISADLAGMLLFLPFPIALGWAVLYGDDHDDGIPWLVDQFLKPSS